MDCSMISPERKFGAIGWVVLVGFVAAWDILTPDSLSSAFSRGCKTPVGRIVVPALWGITTAHLFGKLPNKVDPFYIAIGFAKGATTRSVKSG